MWVQIRSDALGLADVYVKSFSLASSSFGNCHRALSYLFLVVLFMGAWLLGKRYWIFSVYCIDDQSVHLPRSRAETSHLSESQD